MSSDMDTKSVIRVMLLLGAVMFVIVVIMILTGCSTSRIDSLQTFPDGQTMQTKASSMALLQDRGASASGSGTQADSGGRHKPSAATMAMRPVVTAGVFLTVVGVLLFLVRFKVPMIPLGASLGVAGLGVFLIALGGFIPALAENLWIVLAAVLVAAITFGPGLWANLRGRFGNNTE